MAIKICKRRNLIMNLIKKCVAECVGTMILVAFGCGVAVITGCSDNGGILATALAFGLVIIAMSFVIGNISGCHINPAVSLAMFIEGKMTFKEFWAYVAGQVVGAIMGAIIVAFLLGSFEDLGGNVVQDLVVTSYGQWAALAIGLVAEIVLTFVFVFAVLGVTSRTDNKAVTGVVIGLTLTLVHLLGIRLTGTSVNPARSIGPALIQMISGDFNTISQIWIFIVGPMLGAAAAAYLYRYLDNDEDISRNLK